MRAPAPLCLSPSRCKTSIPASCACGQGALVSPTLYQTHPVIELPPIDMQITHFLLHQGRCVGCGTLLKAQVPFHHPPGSCPRWTALLAELTGMQGTSRRLLQDCCHSVLHIPRSLGAIQKVIDRASHALVPHYEAIAQMANSGCRVSEVLTLRPGPPCLPQRPSRGPRPRRTLASSALPILLCMSRPRLAVLRLAASRCGRRRCVLGTAPSPPASSARRRGIGARISLNRRNCRYFPPLTKGGEGGFSPAASYEIPPSPLYERGALSRKILNLAPMRRRGALGCPEGVKIPHI